MARPNPPPSVVPPADIQAEQSVIGAMLIEPQAVRRAQGILGGSDFYRDGHQTLFGCIVAMTERHETPDLTTLGAELRNRNRLEAVGGEAYLLAVLDAVPSAANVEHYAKIVLEKSLLRQLLFASMQAADAAQQPTDCAQDVVSEAHRKIYAIASRSTGAGFRPLGEAVMRVSEEFEARVDDPVTTVGLSTGFREVDRLLCGLQPGGYYILAGRPSMGKTAAALEIALNVAESGRAVAIFSGEMTEEELVLRMVSSRALVDGNALRTGHVKKGESERAMAAMGGLYNLPIRVLDNPDTTVDGMIASCRQLKADGALSLLVVDYIGLLNGRKAWGSRREEVGEISRGLKKLAQELKIPLLALSQLSRSPEGRESKRPVLSDLRESGDLEQDADAVCFLYRQAYYDRKETHLIEPDGTASVEEAEFIVAKHRNGPTGIARIGFTRQFAKFSDSGGGSHARA